MSFRLVLKSVALNDLDRRHGPYFALIHRDRQLSGHTAYNWLKTQRIAKLSATEM